MALYKSVYYYYYKYINYAVKSTGEFTAFLWPIEMEKRVRNWNEFVQILQLLRRLSRVCRRSTSSRRVQRWGWRAKPVACLLHGSYFVDLPICLLLLLLLQEALTTAATRTITLLTHCWTAWCVFFVLYYHTQVSRGQTDWREPEVSD